MSDIVFSSELTLVKCMEGLCTKAIRIAANRLLGKLQELLISDFYDTYTPDSYSRTYNLYNSAMVEMLSTACAEILMNPDSMNYKNGFSGIDSIDLASQGYHGSEAIDTEKKFWEDFEKYCNKNAIKILKEELKKQGINIK